MKALAMPHLGTCLVPAAKGPDEPASRVITLTLHHLAFFVVTNTSSTMDEWRRQKSNQPLLKGFYIVHMYVPCKTGESYSQQGVERTKV